MSGLAPDGGARIEGFVVRHVAHDLERPFRSGIHSIRTMHNVVVTAHCGGVAGHGYTFAFNRALCRATRELVLDLAGALAGAQVSRVREHWRTLWERTNFAGHAGPPVMAISAIDTALWDLRARLLGVPLAELLGGAADPRPAYASGGSLALDADQLAEEAKLLAGSGFGGYKMRVGLPDLDEDLARVAAVRRAIGDLPLMVDANQAWDLPTAERAMAALEPLGLGWVEEPIDAEDVAGLAALRSRHATPVAAGETVWCADGSRRLLEAGAVDLLQPDLMRCAGVSGMLEVGSLAAAHRTPVSTHLYSEAAPHLMAAMPTAASVECFPGWFDHLFGPVRVAGGMMMPAEGPGLGVELLPSVEQLVVDREEV